MRMKKDEDGKNPGNRILVNNLNHEEERRGHSFFLVTL